MPPTNTAAWLPSKAVNPLQIGPAPYPVPASGQIVVQNSAIAINQVDWAKQLVGDLALGYIKYPFILGGDVAGTVVDIGPDVHRFRVGDRVLAHAAAIVPASNNPAEGAFQHFTLIREFLAAPLPGSMTEVEGCVLPLCLSTAAYGLFHPQFLGLDMPTTSSSSKKTEAGLVETIVITGGASSVGCSAIQLAVAAGYQVVTTASPKNFEYLKQLGATHVFDYKSATAADDILASLKGQSVLGAYAIGDGSAQLCTAVLQRHSGPTRKFVAFAGGGLPVNWLRTYIGTARFIASTIWTMGRTAMGAYMAGVEVKFVDGNDLCDVDGVVGRLYRDFVPGALEQKRLVPAPPPSVVGQGLEQLQEAMDIHSRGVSAQKVVVTI